MNIPVSSPEITDIDKKAVLECLDSDIISGISPYTQRFGTAFAKWNGQGYGFPVNSGTSALHLALATLGVKRGDEVIMPSFTMISSANAAAYLGAKPVFVDIEPDTWCMDASKIKDVITPLTKAIMPVHLYGHPCEITDIMEVAWDHDLYVVEDAAEAHGATYKGKHVGGFGDIGCYSFYANKIITCFPAKTHISIKPPQGKGSRCIKYIEEIKVGDKVLTYNEETSEKEYERVVRLYKSEAPLLLNLKLSNGNELAGTPNHPIYVIGKGWVPMKKLEVGDELLQYRYRYLGIRKQHLNQAGKTYEELYGEEKAASLKSNHSLILREIHNNPNSGYLGMYTLKWKKSIGDGNRGKKRSLETRRKMSVTQKEKWDKVRADPEKYESFCKLMSEIANKPEMIARHRETSLRIGQDPVYRKKLSEGVRRAMENPEYWKNYMRGQNMKPNKPELKLGNLLDEICPNEFGYNGDFRLGVVIDRLIPDFVNINGKNKIIEMFGSYWHKPEETAEKTKRYRQQGYESLIVWEQELKDEKALRKKILEFVHNPNVELATITHIEEMSHNKSVYNIETEKNHNYFAYGILVHNCGEGGMMTFNDEELYERAAWLGAHAFGRKGVHYWHTDVGYGYRMTGMQAALGLSQLNRIGYYIQKRQMNAWYYMHLLSDLRDDGLITFPVQRKHCTNVYWMFSILLTDEGLKRVKRDKLISLLAERGVETRTFFYPLHIQPPYAKRLRLPVTMDVYKRGINLPSGNTLSKQEIEYVCDAVKEIIC